jgi:hypothetical protein
MTFKTTAKPEGNIHLLNFNYNAMSKFTAEAMTSASKIQFERLDHSEGPGGESSDLIWAYEASKSSGGDS